MRFRDTIQRLIPAYSAATTKLDKTLIVSQVVDAVRDQGGSFIKHESNRRHSRIQWYDIGDKLAREKIGQNFRDTLHAKYKSSTKAKRTRYYSTGKIAYKKKTKNVLPSPNLNQIATMKEIAQQMNSQKKKELSSSTTAKTAEKKTLVQRLQQPKQPSKRKPQQTIIPSAATTRREEEPAVHVEPPRNRPNKRKVSMDPPAPLGVRRRESLHIDDAAMSTTHNNITTAASSSSSAWNRGYSKWQQSLLELMLLPIEERYVWEKDDHHDFHL